MKKKSMKIHDLLSISNERAEEREREKKREKEEWNLVWRRALIRAHEYFMFDKLRAQKRTK